MSSTTNTKIDIRFGLLFPWQFILVGVAFIAVGVGLLMTNLLLSVIFFVLGLVMLTAFSGTEIDFEAKTYREYNSFLMIKTGKVETFDAIERIFLTKSNESQKVYTAHTLHSATFKKEVYNAFLKFSNGEKVHLFRSKNKSALLKKLNNLLELPGLEWVDHT